VTGEVFGQVLYVGSWANVALVNSLLEREGIATMVATDKVSPRYRRAVHLLDPTEVGKAREIVERFVRREPMKDPKSYRSWRCRGCNELIEGQFEVCWNCGESRVSSSPN
jgi:hypothetical protein